MVPNLQENKLTKEIFLDVVDISKIRVVAVDNHHLVAASMSNLIASNHMRRVTSHS